MKVALLCADDAHHRYLSALLHRHFEVVLTVVEPGACQTRRWRRIGRWRDYLAWSYHGWRRRLLGLDRYRRRAFALHPATPGRDLPGHRTEWICDPRVVRLLGRAAPDVTVVMGTGILSREVLAAAGPVVLNLHGGYLPDYRGNHCVFWALYHADFDRIGASIHRVDPSVDGGPLVDRVVPEIDLGANAEALYCRAEKLGVHRLIELLERLAATGELPERPRLPPGRLYRTRDRKPWHDLVLWLRRTATRLGIPNRWGRRWHAWREKAEERPKTPEPRSVGSAGRAAEARID